MIRRMLSNKTGACFVVVFGALFFVSSLCAVLLPASYEGQWCRLWLNHYFAILPLLAACAVLYRIPPVRAGMHKIGHIAGLAHRLPDWLWVGAAALAFFSLTYYLSGALFSHVPTETDSMSQYAGARMFAQGMWAAPSHPLPKFFDTLYFFNDGKFYTFYPPGHMFLLALGHLAGNPAVVNPLLGSLSLIATYFLTREVGGAKAARVALLLFLISPFIVFLSAEFDNRSTALLCCTLFALFAIKAIKTYRSWCGLIAGVALGYLFITRPQIAFPYALPFALLGVRMLWQQWRGQWKIFAAMIVGVVPFILFFLFYNWQTNGDPFLTGYQKYWGPEVVPASGFTTVEFWRSHWPHQAGRSVAYVQLLDRQFFCWPIPSLLGVMALFFLRAQRPFCAVLAASFLSVVASLTITPYISIIFGPRYLYETSSIVIALTAIAMVRLPAIARRHATLNLSLSEWRGWMVVVGSVLVGIALSTTIKDLYHEYGHDYRIGRLGFARMIDQSVKKPALVIIRGRQLYYGLAYRQPPDDANDVIYAHDMRADNQRIIDYYPNRHVYFTPNETQIIPIR